jgi:hypothetical protein
MKHTDLSYFIVQVWVRLPHLLHKAAERLLANDTLVRHPDHILQGTQQNV